jgi:HK97 family phage prohead protease
MPGFFEEVDSHALDGCDMSDVIFQVDHEGTPLARLRNNTMRLGTDEVGAWVEADLGGSQRGRDIYESIQNGLIDRMSFGFTLADDGFEWEEDDDGVIHTRITKISRLYDTSCVTWPANPSTDISARSYVQAAIDAKHEADRIAAEEERAAQEAEQQRLAEEAAEQERIAAAIARRKRRARAMQI